LLIWYPSNARCRCCFNFSKHDYREALISNAFSFLGLYFLYRLVPFVVNEYRLRACFAYMVFPVLLVCNLVSYSEPLFLAFTIGAYYYWKREKFGYAALLAVFSIFTRQVGAFIVVIFLVDMLYAYFSHRERSRVIRELAVVAITCAGVAMLYPLYLYASATRSSCRALKPQTGKGRSPLPICLTTWARAASKRQPGAL